MNDERFCKKIATEIQLKAPLLRLDKDKVEIMTYSQESYERIVRLMTKINMQLTGYGIFIKEYRADKYQISVQTFHYR